MIYFGGKLDKYMILVGLISCKCFEGEMTTEREKEQKKMIEKERRQRASREKREGKISKIE